jgi:hypothetical protein
VERRDMTDVVALDDRNSQRVAADRPLGTGERMAIKFLPFTSSYRFCEDSVRFGILGGHSASQIARE